MGSSDKSILKRLAQHKWNHLLRQEKGTAEKARKNYPDIDNDDNKLIKWFKEANGDLIPNEEEFIQRDDGICWNKLGKLKVR